MRIEPRSNLTVQLIQEAALGPGRIDPSGPRLRLTSEVPTASASLASTPAIRPQESHAVEPKPASAAADPRRNDCVCPPVLYKPVVYETHVSRVIETTTLASHLAGALLDTLA